MICDFLAIQKMQKRIVNIPKYHWLIYIGTFIYVGYYNGISAFKNV